VNYDVATQAYNIFIFDFVYQTALGIQNTINVPEKFSLFQNYPNPFNPVTTITWQVAERGYTTLKIYDILGNEIKTLINEEQSSGKYEITFDASEFSSGVYFYKLNAISNNAEYFGVKKLMILK
jgi:hypothetical protein